jgi:hypothetical protein
MISNNVSQDCRSARLGEQDGSFAPLKVLFLARGCEVGMPLRCRLWLKGQGMLFSSRAPSQLQEMRRTTISVTTIRGTGLRGLPPASLAITYSTTKPRV